MRENLDRSPESKVVAKDMGFLNIEYVRIIIIKIIKVLLLLVKRNCSNTGWLFCRICQTFFFFVSSFFPGSNLRAAFRSDLLSSPL